MVHANYTEDLKTSREGVDQKGEELSKLDELMTPLISKVQSITHIYVHHKHEIKCSKRTLYMFFEQNLFKARKIDLPRKVKYKPRKKETESSDRKSKHRIDRTYEDFKRFIENHPEKHIVEMDVVEGKSDALNESYQ